MKARMSSKRWALLYVVVIIVAAAIGYASFNLYRDAISVIPNDLRIERVSKSGFTGGGDGKNMVIENGMVTYSGGRAMLEQEQLAEIVKRIDRANFFELPTSETRRGCADGYVNTLTITAQQKTRTVTFNDCDSDMLQSLMDLDDYLRKLIR